LPEGAVVEEFDTPTLGPLWSVDNPDPAQWSLTERPGQLRIHSLPGDTYQGSNSARNLFLRDIPRGDFQVVAGFEVPVTLDFQNAGILAWQDTDNYLRAGLAHVGFAGGTVIENGLEVNAGYSSTFTARAGVSTEVLKVARAGDVFTTSYWDGSAWVQAAQVTAHLDVTRVGLFALSAQDRTPVTADFDFVAVQSADPQPVTPAGRFGLDGGTASGPFLAVGPNGAVTASARRSPTQLAVTAEPLGGGIALREVDSGRYLAAGRSGRIALSAKASGTARSFRLLDAGGGKVQLVTGAGDPVSVRHGELAVTPDGTATRLLVRPYDGAAANLAVDGTAKGTAISDDLYGIFYEDINAAADGGLYAELVRNRSFEFDPVDNSAYTALTGWSPVLPGGGTATVLDTDPLNATNLHYLRLRADAAGAGVSNAGYNAGIALRRGAGYRFSVWARSATAVPLTVAVRSADGATSFASGRITVRAGGWAKYEVPLRAAATTDAGRLVVTSGAAGTLDLDMVSLFPQDTFRGRPNGMRQDLAELVDGLNPSFLRFPGGCVANVGSFEPFPARKRIYRWKDTVGPVEARPTNFNFWGYNQSYGIGYYEYLQFAEDIGAAALPVIAVGVTGCGGTDRLTEDQLAPFVADTLDLIEFANGPATSAWGSVRAKMGHPKPFGLRYLALGNEEYDPQFYANYPHFARAIEAAHPEIQVISNAGQSSQGAVFDRSWAFAREQGADLVDEHYYNSPAWFLANNHRYDSYDRTGPKVFVGEYASQGNAFGNALAEASYLTGLERNSDVVKLASYAPLLANVDYVDWTPDLIWFDNDQAYGSASYHVQQLFSNNRGDTVLPSRFSGGTSGTLPDIAGGVGLATWNTQARYDNVKVTGADGRVLLNDDFSSGATDWTPSTGSWTVEDGQYVQSSNATDARSTADWTNSTEWSNYTLDVDATKTGGAEGFLVMFGVQDTGTYYWWNLGGWGNTTSAVEKAAGGGKSTIATSTDTIETGRTYHLRITLQGRTIRLYLDGRLVNEFADNLGRTDPLYQVVTKDRRTGDTIVKVVNARDTALRTDVTLSGPPLGGTATVSSLTGAPADLNSLAEPDKVTPVTLRQTLWQTLGQPLGQRGPGNRFSYDFPAHSVSFLRLPGRR
jgi:alpha-L-arabinofuranosidase